MNFSYGKNQQFSKTRETEMQEYFVETLNLHNWALQ